MEPQIRDYLLEKQAINGWTQEEMAAKIGVPIGTLNRWLHGHFVPRYEAMQKIAFGLKVPMQEVLDAREGRYKPLSVAARKALEIRRLYDKEALREYFRLLPAEELADLLQEFELVPAQPQHHKELQ